MQSANKLVLVDEVDREYKRLQRPADAVAKTGKSLQLSHTLGDTALADDRKVRDYVTALHRYLNTHKEPLPEPSVTVNPLIQLAPAVGQQLPQQEIQQKYKKKKKGKNKKQRLAWDQPGSGLKRPSLFWDKY